MSEWRDISTVPKDGTVILLYSIGAYLGLPFPGKWLASDFHPDRPWISMLKTQDRLYEHVPTHWMPLPSPPNPLDNVTDSE